MSSRGLGLLLTVALGSLAGIGPSRAAENPCLTLRQTIPERSRAVLGRQETQGAYVVWGRYYARAVYAAWLSNELREAVEKECPGGRLEQILGLHETGPAPRRDSTGEYRIQFVFAAQGGGDRHVFDASVKAPSLGQEPPKVHGVAHLTMSDADLKKLVDMMSNHRLLTRGNQSYMVEFPWGHPFVSRLAATLRSEDVTRVLRRIVQRGGREPSAMIFDGRQAIRAGSPGAEVVYLVFERRVGDDRYELPALAVTLSGAVVKAEETFFTAADAQKMVDASDHGF